jgi:hypothetical protein
MTCNLHPEETKKILQSLAGKSKVKNTEKDMSEKERILEK